MAKMRVDTQTIFDEAKAVLAQYDSAITVRQLYYRLVARHVIENSVKSYSRLVGFLTRWRKEGLIDPRVFVDLTRQPESRRAWNNLAIFMEAVKYSYRRDLWQGQGACPEVWLEKQALATVFIPLCQRLQVTLQVCRGYPSISTLIEAADRRTTHIIYFGDWDSSGVDIDRSIRDELQGTWGHELSIVRRALLPEQIEEHELPPAPAKDSDSRTASFREAHGDDTVELDALPPEVLERYIEDSVLEFVDDQDEWERQEGIQQQEQLRLKKFVDGLQKRRE